MGFTRLPRISPKSLYKLILTENASKSAFYTVIFCERGPKVAKNWTILPNFRLLGPYKAPNLPMGYIKGPRLSQWPPQISTKRKCIQN